MPGPTLERKIHFYRADVGHDNSGKPLAFDPALALQEIEKLPFTEGIGGRYGQYTDGNEVCLLPTPPGSSEMLRFCLVRRSGLPQVERSGSFKDLDLEPDAGLSEPIHIVFFANNIVGAEYNHHGPRISRLGEYLHTKSNKFIQQVRFLPLLRQDIADQLNNLTEIRLFELKIRPSYIAAVRQADQSLADALEANGRVVDAPETLQIVARSSTGGRESTLTRLMAPVRGLLSRDDLRANVEHFKVSGKRRDTGRVAPIDLLNAHLIANKRVVRVSERSRVVESVSAFEAIREARDELADQIADASAVSELI